MFISSERKWIQIFPFIIIINHFGEYPSTMAGISTSRCLGMWYIRFFTFEFDLFEIITDWAKVDKVFIYLLTLTKLLASRLLTAYGSSSISIDRNVNLFLFSLLHYYYYYFFFLAPFISMLNNALNNNHLLNFALFKQSDNFIKLKLAWLSLNDYKIIKCRKQQKN